MKLKCLLTGVVIYTPHYMGSSLNSCFKKLSALGLFLILMKIFIGISLSKVACVLVYHRYRPLLLYSSYLYLQSSLGLPVFHFCFSHFQQPLVFQKVFSTLLKLPFLIVFNDSTANSIQVFQELILHFFFLFQDLQWLLFKVWKLKKKKTNPNLW